MGVEQATARTRTYETIRPSLKEKALHWSGPLIRTAVEKGIIATYIEYPEGFRAEFMQAMAERNEKGKQKYSIFIVSRHSSHPDGFIVARLALDLKTMANSVLPAGMQTAGFFMPLAQSLEEGQQDRPMMQVYHEIKPTLKTFGIVPAPIVRQKDVVRYDMQKDEDEDARMRALIREGYNNIVLFPEGTTTAGKTNPETGDVYGMVHFELNSIKRSYLFLKRNAGTESLFIPTATFGGRKILNPDNKWVSPTRFFTALVSPYPTIAHVKVGLPLRSDEGELEELLKGRHKEGLNNFFGKRIAKMLPSNERGKYA